MTDSIQILHNPRCSKSRQTLALLEAKGIEPEVILYLETPPTAQDLAVIIQKLGITPRELMRNKEAEFKEQGLKDPELSDAQLIEAMINTPKLIERPIVICGDKAVLGRPPENIDALF
ncbi:MAG: arsenate reductase (glutaredoxin) [Pseudomonadales bacterium]|nr:arsenate reductase (glutaredoxin) [Pseudomonadales bacterium]